MGTVKQYDEEFKKQAVKLAKEIGNKSAADELGIPKGTLGMWLRKAKTGEIDTGSGTCSPEESLNLAQQLQAQIRTCPHRNGAWIFEQILSRTRQNFADLLSQVKKF